MVMAIQQNFNVDLCTAEQFEKKSISVYFDQQFCMKHMFVQV